MWILLCMRPSNEKRRYIDTSSLIAWPHTQNDSCIWASFQISKIAVCACAGNVGNVFPATDFKGNRLLAIPACITARAPRTCRGACRDR